jgi:hypothetical protein
MSRLEKLKKWRAERELKAKLEAMEKAKSKPGFQFKHLTHDDKDLFLRQQPVAGSSTSFAKPAAQQPPSKAAAVSSYHFRFQFFFLID